MGLITDGSGSILIRKNMDQILYGLDSIHLAEDFGKPNLRVEESVGTVFWLRASENRI